jgi:hypothetical protein
MTTLQGAEHIAHDVRAFMGCSSHRGHEESQVQGQAEAPLELRLKTLTPLLFAQYSASLHANEPPVFPLRQQDGRHQCFPSE